MFRDPMRVSVFALAALAGPFGCDDGADAPDPAPMQEPEPAAEPEPDPGPQAIVPSHKARVKFKGGERYARDLAAALDVERGELCLELGRFDCVTEVHGIALGGVEPYDKGIDEPLPVAPVSAAIAVDRVALSACTARVDADLEDPAAAVIFGGLLRAEEPSRAALEGVAADLVDRILRRDATPDEVAAIADFYAEVEAETDDAAVRAFGQLSCFAVATMLEALFY